MKQRWWMMMVVMLALLGGCGTPTPAAPAELRIGVISMLTEPYASTDGKWMNNALELAVKQVNAAGGVEVNGQRYRLVLVVEDDQNSPQEAAAAATRLINQKNVVAIIGPLYSGTALAAGQVAENARVPMISPTATSPAVTTRRQYIFRACFNDELQGQALARFLRVTKGYNYAGMLYDVSDAYNAALASSFKQYFEQVGGRVLVEKTYTADVSDFSAYLESFANRNLQLVFLPDYPEKLLKQAQQLREAGIQAVLVGGDSWDGADVSLPALDGSYYSTHWFASLDAPVSQAFVKAYQEAYGEVPNPTAALSYDALQLIIAAVRAQGEVSPEAITRGLQGLHDFSGVTGTISYTQGGDPQKDVFIMHVANGERVFVTSIRP